jgi:hypothetical protein
MNFMSNQLFDLRNTQTANGASSNLLERSGLPPQGYAPLFATADARANDSSVIASALERQYELSAEMQSINNGNCLIGEEKDSVTQLCSAKVVLPSGLNTDIMIESSNTLEEQSCGLWQQQGSDTCVSCPKRYYAIQGDPVHEQTRWQRVSTRMRLRRKSVGVVNHLLDQCEATQQAGVRSVLISSRLAFLKMVQELPKVETLEDALQSIGMVGAYGCNTIVRVGSVLQRHVFTLEAANMQSTSSDVLMAALQMLDASSTYQAVAWSVMKGIWDADYSQHTSNGLSAASTGGAHDSPSVRFPSQQMSACVSGEEETISITDEELSTIVSHAMQRQIILNGVRGRGTAGLTMLRRLVCALVGSKQRTLHTPLDSHAKLIMNYVTQSSVAMCVASIASAIHVNNGDEPAAQQTEALAQSHLQPGVSRQDPGTLDSQHAASSPSESAQRRLQETQSAKQPRTGSHTTLVPSLGRVSRTIDSQANGAQAPLTPVASPTTSTTKPAPTHDGMDAIFLEGDRHSHRYAQWSALQARRSRFDPSRDSTDRTNSSYTLYVASTRDVERARVDSAQRVHAANAFDEVLSEPTLSQWTTSAMSTISDMRFAIDHRVQSATSDSCLSVARFVAPDAFDEAAFQATMTRSMISRMDYLYQKLRTSMLESLLAEHILHEVIVDDEVLQYYMRKTQVIIPGAPADTAFGRERHVFRPPMRSEDGAVYNILQSSKATKKTTLSTLALNSDACDAPPLFDAQTANAYFQYPSNCIVLFLGLATAPIIDTSFDDEAMLGRFMWIMAHELAHSTAWSRRFRVPYEQLLQQYSWAEREEGFADIVATVAVAKALNTNNVHRILMHVSQVFCISRLKNTRSALSLLSRSNYQGARLSDQLKPYTALKTYNDSDASNANGVPAEGDELERRHPSHLERTTLVCNAIHWAHTQGLLSVDCLSPDARASD